MLHAVTLPDGVTAGQTIHVQAPDGRLNEIIVPPGFGPGSTFTVEFAPAEEAAPPTPVAPVMAQASVAPAGNTAAGSSVPPPAPGVDDGFASGFNNPHWRPPPPQPAAATAPTATAVTAVSAHNEPEVYVPTTSAAYNANTSTADDSIPAK